MVTRMRGSKETAVWNGEFRKALALPKEVMSNMTAEEEEAVMEAAAAFCELAAGETPEKTPEAILEAVSGSERRWAALAMLTLDLVRDDNQEKENHAAAT